MDNPGYVGLTRQIGLLKEMQSIAMNIANASTTGYRREDVVFSEYVKASQTDGESLSMGAANAHFVDTTQGALWPSGGPFDLAVEGEGYFLIDTPNGERLSRHGAFALSPEGELVTADGHRVLDGGGAPIFLPPDAASVSFGADGTISVDDAPIGQIDLVTAEPRTLLRESATMFVPQDGYEPAVEGRIAQGFLEQSNVDPVIEISRMIEVQRAFELGQGLVDREDDRITKLIQALGRPT